MITSAPLRSVRGCLRLVVRVVSLTAIITAPALIARRDAHAWRQYTQHVGPADWYLAHRSPVIDALLPAGAGGTVFVSTLPEVRGLANARTASIVISLKDAQIDELERAEVHERAHLLHAQHDTLVHALMVQLDAPDPAEYAATNVGEHFAEMAQGAWGLLNPGDICPVETPPEQLRTAERLVPGTAGFVVYMLRHPSLAAHPDAPILRHVADSLIAPERADWERLFAALEAQRQPKGALSEWPVPTMGDWLAREQRMMRAEGTLWSHLQSIVFWPSAAFLRVIGR